MLTLKVSYPLGHNFPKFSGKIEFYAGKFPSMKGVPYLNTLCLADVLYGLEILGNFPIFSSSKRKDFKTDDSILLFSRKSLKIKKKCY